MIKGILLLNVYKFTGAEIGELRDAVSKNMGILGMTDQGYLPKYVVRREGNALDTAADYLYYVTEGEETYILFDVAAMDNFAQNEVDMVGFEEVFEDSDLAKLLADSDVGQTVKQYNRALPHSTIIELEITVQGDYEDVEVSIYCSKIYKK